MRATIVLLLLVGCGRPAGSGMGAEEPQDPMPSSTLEHQNPAADTSKNPTLHTYGSRWHWPSFFHFGGPPDPFASVGGAAPHYYTGCGGCSSHDPSNALIVFALMPLVVRRRRVRAARRPSP
ncbi:MAG TPA: hypothetical protein VMZ53_03130 [Kofleriaceae bacterium]|nr:hypothetical protein [Kofleriaceae bacterium]